jgi:hypothetical protein
LDRLGWRVDPGDRNVAGLQRTKAEVPNEAAVHSDNLYLSNKNPGRFTPRNAAGSQRQHSKKAGRTTHRNVAGSQSLDSKKPKHI